MSSEAKFTKGPWHVEPQQDGSWEICTEKRGAWIMRLNSTTEATEDERAEDLANAQLMASAPDLLEACLLFARWAQAGQNFQYPPGSLQQVTAAIARALGQ